jgi:predicted RNA-binding Zn ribbon-like protein
MGGMPELPFKYLGGDASLDLVNTVDWTARGLENERLIEFENLTRWAEGAGVLSGTDAAHLRRVGGERPVEAQAAYDAALRLRSVLQQLFSAIAAGQCADSSWADFNELLGEALQWLCVAPGAHGQAVWDWSGRGEVPASLLWPVVWSAAVLVTSEEARRIRVCAGPDCGWMYVDRSRNRLRRWCQMETCGTQEKSRRRFERAHSEQLS